VVVSPFYRCPSGRGEELLAGGEAAAVMVPLMAAVTGSEGDGAPHYGGGEEGAQPWALAMAREVGGWPA
jgi:hypothetical protein